jgi:hypothetical protein
VKVSYRIVEEVTPRGTWETVGVITFWPEAPPHMQLRGMLQHTVSRSIWSKIRERVKERHLTLETYHEALEKNARSYRLQPETHLIVAETAAEIQRQLREKYIFLRETVASA